MTSTAAGLAEHEFHVAAAVRDESGVVVAAVASFEDITASKATPKADREASACVHHARLPR